MRLFSPRKTTLLFVIRDKTKVYTLHPLMRTCPVLYYYIHLFTMFLAFCTDSVGKFGAYSKRRYSKGDFSSFLSLFHLFGFLFYSPSFVNMKWIPQIWDGVPKPQAHLHTPLSEFFNVRRSIHLPFSHACLIVYVYVVAYDQRLFMWRWKLLLCQAMRTKRRNSKRRYPFMSYYFCFKEFVQLFFLILELEWFLNPIAS